MARMSNANHKKKYQNQFNRIRHKRVMSLEKHIAENPNDANAKIALKALRKAESGKKVIPIREAAGEPGKPRKRIENLEAHCKLHPTDEFAANKYVELVNKKNERTPQIHEFRR